LLVDLFALHKDEADLPGREEIPAMSAAGRTSVPVDPAFLPEIYSLVGFKICGKRAVRIDILERLADLIRPLMAWKPGGTGDKPQGAIDGPGFTVTVDMTSLLGCAGDDFSEVLKSLGYRMERKPIEKQPEPAPVPTDTQTDAQAAEPAPAETAIEGPSSSEQPAQATEAQPESPPQDAAPKEAVSEEAAPVQTASTDAPAEPDTPEQPASQPAETAPAKADTAEEEDSFIEVWRPKSRYHNDRSAGRRDNKRNQNQKPGNNKSDKQGKGKRPAGKRDNDRNARNKNNPSSRPPRPEKKIDPDSPFAALAALKQDLTKKK
jgi:ATP-dependent RNA helicase SUPV3L1/SUV3